MERALSHNVSYYVVKKPLVSCCMPTRNRRSFVSQSIKYFQRQDYPYKELIIVDDGEDKIQDIIPTDENIHYYYLNSKVSLGEARNISISHSKGEIIVTWDDDDWYSYSRISKQIEPILENTADLTCFEFLYNYDIIKNEFWESSAIDQKRLPHLGTISYKKRIWRDYIKYQKISLGEDEEFFKECKNNNFRLKIIPNIGEFSSIGHLTNRWNVIFGYNSNQLTWEKIDIPNFIPNEDRLFYNNLKKLKISEKNLNIINQDIIEKQKELVISTRKARDKFMLRNKELSERNLEILKRNKELRERNQEIVKRNKELRERNQEIVKRNKELRERNLELRQLKFRIETTEKIFTDIYNENKWRNKQSRSGPGSTLAQTETMRSKLPELLEEYHIHSILDIPCGDFNWMKEVNLDSISYIGADIVEKIIQFNNEEYSKENRKFVKIDILKDELPQVDLIFCRDLFIHFSYRDIFTAIENIKKSGSKYLLATSNRPETINFDILTGEWRPINLLTKPLSFPSPLKVVDEKTNRESDKGQSLLLWKIRDLNLKMI